MNPQIKCTILYPLLVLAFAVDATQIASADLLVEKGQHAILTINVTVEGNVEKPQGHRDEVVMWSTKRSFGAKVEMLADKAERQSFSASLDGPSDSTRAALEDIQKQAQACGEDKICQMRVAMQAMNSPALHGATDGPLRYQVWRAVGKEGAQFEATGSHTETLHTVFYTAARETTDCTMTAPNVSPELIKMDPTSKEKWEASNKETLKNNARAFVVEIDSVDMIGILNVLSPLSVGSGNIECVQNIGSGPETSQHSTAATLLPTEEMKLPLKVSGTATDSDVLASGSSTIKSSQRLNNLGVGFAVDVVAPLEITVRWELNKL